MWVIPESIRLVCAREPGCSMSEWSSLVSDSGSGFEPWLTLSGKQVQRTLCWRGWKARAWSPHLFGSTASSLCLGNLYVGAWMRSLPDSRAPISRWRESRQEQPGSDTFCQPSSKLLARLGPDGYFWRTSTESFLPGMEPPLTKFSGRWPRSGGVRNGCLYERPMLELPTVGIGGSAWPTATSRGGYSPSETETRQGAEDLQTRAKKWATPRAAKTTSENPEEWEKRKAAGEVSTPPLTMQASMWKTPRANEGNAGDWQTNQADPENPFVTLNGQAKNWPTPNANPAAPNNSKNRGKDHGGARARTTDQCLENRAKNWPTPEASLSDKLTGLESQNSLAKAVRFSHLDQTTSDGEKSSKETPTSARRLNPAFVSWLMGWPWWWTRPGRISCERQEMELWRCRLRWHLAFYLGDFYDER